MGRFFGLGTDLPKHEIRFSSGLGGKYAHVRRRLESSGHVTYKRGESMQCVSTKMDSEADAIYNSLERVIY